MEQRKIDRKKERKKERKKGRHTTSHFEFNIAKCLRTLCFDLGSMPPRL
jgi:hypothetical protein